MPAALLLLFFAIGLLSGVLQRANSLFAEPVFSQLTILTSDGVRHDFMVEVADDPQARARGLMFRRSLDANRGMLFDFEHNTEVQMWMKNTYISLDMLFLLENGTIHRIERNTEPHSLRVISSFGKVRGVLELPAGSASALGLKPGDTVLHDMFAH